MTTSYATHAAIAVTSWTTTLAGGEQASSAIVDNTSNKYDDALVGGTITFGASHVDGDIVSIYAWGNYDIATSTDLTGGIGTLFAGADQEEIDGTDITLRNMYLLTTVVCDAASNVQHWGPIAIAPSFGGVLPEKWGLLADNEDASAALGAVATLGYTGITFS